MRLQLFEYEFSLPAYRVGLRDAWGIEGVGLNISQVKAILGALGKSDRNQANTTANRAPDAGVDASLKRHLDFDIEDITLQSAGHLLEPYVDAPLAASTTSNEGRHVDQVLSYVRPLDAALLGRGPVWCS